MSEKLAKWRRKGKGILRRRKGSLSSEIASKERIVWVQIRQGLKGDRKSTEITPENFSGHRDVGYEAMC